MNFKSDRNWSIYQLLLLWIANAFEVKVDLLHFAVFHCFRPNLIGFQVIVVVEDFSICFKVLFSKVLMEISLKNTQFTLETLSKSKLFLQHFCSAIVFAQMWNWSVGDKRIRTTSFQLGQRYPWQCYQMWKQKKEIAFSENTKYISKTNHMK